MRKIEIDLEKTMDQADRSYNVCVGGGRAFETLLAENQRHLKIVHDDCGFQYLRFHGLLHDDMSAYHEDRNGNAYYNWQYVDLLFDSMLKIGVKPFVELSFMPAALASGKETVFVWKANITMPRDMKKWCALIEALVKHFTARYGENEVKSWFFEVWNEPNLDIFFASKSPFEDYMKLYATTAQAVKKANPLYRVGGPATAGCGWISEFIEACVSEHLPVDFISTHTYGVDGFVDEFGERTQKLIYNEDSVSNDMIHTRDLIKKSDMPKLPLYFTEWSSSYSPRDNAHDSYHEAAFVLTRIKKAYTYVDAMSYWVFSDIFEESGPGPAPFHGGFGMLNVTGLKKPAYFAYHYLNKLGDTMLECTDKRAFCAKIGEDVQALFWDYTMPKQETVNQEYFVQDIPSAPVEDASVKISNMKPGQYMLELYGIGYRMNDVFTLYRELDTKNGLSKAQEEYLSKNCSGAPTLTQCVEVGKDGVFSYQHKMRENDVFLLNLKKL